MSENEAIFRRWVQEVWNENKLVTIKELFHENGTAVCPVYKNENAVRGVDNLRAVFYQAKQILLDTVMIVDEISSENEKVLAICSLSAKMLKKDFDGNVEEIPVHKSALFKMKISEGQIHEIWSDLELD